MRRSSATGGQLPRMMAAYNAGPLPVARWAAIPGQGDPLLWIESIPYWETRYYVPAVFRNMWVYQGLAHAETPTLSAIAQHRWPAFPTSRTNLSDTLAFVLDLFARRPSLGRCRSSSIRGRGATRNSTSDALQSEGARGRRRLARQRRSPGRRDQAPDHRHHRAPQVDPDPQQLARHRLRPLDQRLSRLRARLHLLLRAADPRLPRPVARASISNRGCSSSPTRRSCCTRRCRGPATNARRSRWAPTPTPTSRSRSAGG